MRVNERLMDIRYPFNRIRHITIVSANTTTDQWQWTKRNLPQNLSVWVKGTPSSDKLVLFCDFYFRIRTSTEILNSKGSMLLIVIEPMFVDDSVLMVHKKSDSQLLINNFSSLFNLIINLDKTKIPLQLTFASSVHSLRQWMSFSTYQQHDQGRWQPE